MVLLHTAVKANEGGFLSQNMPSIAFLESPAAWCAFAATLAVFGKDLAERLHHHHHPNQHSHQQAKHGPEEGGGERGAKEGGHREGLHEVRGQQAGGVCCTWVRRQCDLTSPRVSLK
jgi:hypothetical protein